MKTLITILFLLIISCNNPKSDDEKQVRAVVHGIIEADNRGDLESVLSFYSPEAILLPPGGVEIKGEAAIRKNYQAIFSSSNLNLSVEEEEIILSGDYAICRGRTKGKIISKTDSTVAEVNDKFLMMLKDSEDQWKIMRLMWN